VRLKATVLLAAFGLAGCAGQNPALVGRWEGERSATPECRYVAFRTTLAADGRFGLAFYEDAARSKLIAKRGGHWLTQKDLVLFDAIGDTKYNTYRYRLIDADTVSYKSITQDKGCALSAYTLHRVPG
jgi:hypothetical protein